MSGPKSFVMYRYKVNRPLATVLRYVEIYDKVATTTSSELGCLRMMDRL